MKRLLFPVALGVLASLLPAQLRRVVVGSGFSSPVFAATPNDPERLFVVEQAGRIMLIKNGTRVNRPFLDIITLVGSGGERGLLGLAFHPNYAQNGTFFVSYTQRSGSSVIARYQVSGNPDVADPNECRSIVIGPIAQPFDQPQRRLHRVRARRLPLHSVNG